MKLEVTEEVHLTMIMSTATYSIKINGIRYHIDVSNYDDGTEAEFRVSDEVGDDINDFPELEQVIRNAIDIWYGRANNIT